MDKNPAAYFLDHLDIQMVSTNLEIFQRVGLMYQKTLSKFPNQNGESKSLFLNF